MIITKEITIKLELSPNELQDIISALKTVLDVSNSSIQNNNFLQRSEKDVIATVYNKLIG